MLTNEQRQNVLALDDSHKFAIATASDVHATTWRTYEVSFQALAKRLAIPVYTSETLEEYFNMTKEEQGRIKDVGGFVGGAIANGRRLKANVHWRSLITLDIDNGKPDILDDIHRALNGTAYIVYSTHKHTPDNPRLRVVIPLLENVLVEKYEPIARRIAGDINIEAMDRTTYQPSRVMFWASVAKDGQYVFEAHSGQYLNGDAVLTRYEDWRDVFGWCYANDELINDREQVAKQADPLTKRGYVGAFNRAYTIPDVIDKWLSDQYEPFKDGRYTYLGGSTAGGLIVYQDGLFCYSHHGTSPTSGQLTNAFDFLRLSLFGDQDLKTRPDLEMNKKPSYKDMIAMLQNDPATVAEFTDLNKLPFDIIDDGKPPEIKPVDEFNDSITWEAAATVKEWLSLLTRDKFGAIESTGANVKIILNNDPNLKGKMAIDSFKLTLQVLGELPWKHNGDEWTDTDDGSLQIYLEQYYQIVGERKIINALNEVAIERAFHPVKDYLNSLVWDGVPRIEQVFQKFFGAEDNPYIQTVAKIHFTASVARIFKSGVKYDTAVVFVGAQGIGKSFFIEKMANGWYNDSLQRVDNKDAYEALIGAWLVELPEMSAMKKADNETIKHFLSKSSDRFRLSYGRRAQTFLRACTFWGSSNDLDFLKDVTGNRRYYPVGCDKNRQTLNAWRDLTPELVGQIWAEAVQLFKDGFSLYMPMELMGVAETVQAEFTEESPLKSIIAEFLEFPWLPDEYELTPQDRYLIFNQSTDTEIGTRLEQGGQRTDRIAIPIIWVEALGNDRTKLTRFDSREISGALQQLNWRRAKTGARFGKYGTQKYYERVKM